jgi:hypothetical protein
MLIVELLTANMTATTTALATAFRKPFAQRREQQDEEEGCCFKMNKIYCSKVVTRGLLRTPNWIL